MYKNSNRRSNHSTENIVDRLISKSRMAKRDLQGIANVSQAENPEKEIMKKPKSVASGSHKDHEEMDNDGNRSVSLQDLQVFCDQLEKFIQYVRNVQDLQFLTYDYPEIVRNRLENDVLELESMLKEINAALRNINKQKAQQSFIKKEKTAIKKTLNRMKDDEFREMENVVALYDKALFSRWESVKTTRKPEVLKSLQTDIKCKQLALENLDTLVTRKLGNLMAFASLIENGNDKTIKDKSIIALPFGPFCPAPNERKSKIPLPPPPPPPPRPSLASRNAARSLSLQRRRMLEMEEESWDSVYTVASDYDAIDQPVIPLTFNNVPDNLIVSFNGNSQPELLSASYICNSNAGSQNELTAGLREEMRTVLQALFGDSRRRDISSMFTDNSRSNEEAEISSKNIELLPLSESRKSDVFGKPI